MLTVGEFSRIARVSTRLLRYYDQQGLLQPVRVDARTGYRYYDIGQLPRLNRILVLKELGFSLTQIVPILNQDIGAPELRGMLTLRRNEAEAAIEAARLRLRQVETRIAQLDDEGVLSHDDVRLRSEPARWLLGTRVQARSFEHAREQITALVARLGQRGRGALRGRLGSLAVVASAEDFDPGQLDLQVGYYIDGPVPPDSLPSWPDGASLSVQHLPEVPRMAACVRIGPPERSHLATAQIGAFVQRHGYRLGTPSREVFVQPPDPQAPERAVVEMQFPVLDP